MAGSNTGLVASRVGGSPVSTPVAQAFAQVVGEGRQRLQAARRRASREGGTVVEQELSVAVARAGGQAVPTGAQVKSVHKYRLGPIGRGEPPREGQTGQSVNARA